MKKENQIVALLIVSSLVLISIGTLILNYDSEITGRTSKDYSSSQNYSGMPFGTTTIFSCPYQINNSGSYDIITNLTSNGTCITVKNSSVDLTCSGNKITGNTTGYGINITQQNNITIRNCIISNFSTGGYLDTVNNSNFINNTFYLNNNSGIFILVSKNSVFFNNNFTNNTYGFYISSFSDNNQINNSLFSNNSYGIYFPSPPIFTGNSNSFSNNAFSENNIGIFLNGANNIFHNTTIDSYSDTQFSFAKYSGIGFSISGISNPPLSSLKNISKYLNITGTGWLVLNISYSDSDVASIDESLLNMYRYNGTWNKINSSSVDTADNIVTANLTQFSIFAPLETSCTCNSCSDCEQKLNSSCTTVILNSNISSNGTCINSPHNFNSKTFDCSNYTITGNTTGYGINITQKNNITIRNCIITEFIRGIHFEHTNKSTIANNTLKNNSYGISIYYGSNSNNIINNKADNNHGGIVTYSGSNNNTILGNIVNNNLYDGIDIASNSNYILNNSLNNNSGQAISFSGSLNNTITNNIIKNNNKSICFYAGSNNNILTNNNISNSTNWDIFVDSSLLNKFFNTTVSSYPTTFSFAEYSGNVNIKGVSSPPSSSLKNISKYLNITSTGWLVLNISYSDSDVASIYESLLNMYRYNGTWNKINSSSVDTANNIVTANLTQFSIFAPLETRVCGNNIIEGTEVCDGTDLNGETCITKGFDSGTLACSSDCLSFDTSSCHHAGGGGGSSSHPAKTTPVYCKQEWECTEWTSCFSDRKQTRVCYDSNECELKKQKYGFTEIIGTGKPEEKRDCIPVKKEIPLCTPSWSCTAIGKCTEQGIDYLCVDLNMCKQDYTEKRQCQFKKQINMLPIILIALIIGLILLVVLFLKKKPKQIELIKKHPVALKQLDEYIEKAIDKGYTKEHITNALIKKGHWKKKFIKQYLNKYFKK